jgi:hypothetical protein
MSTGVPICCSSTSKSQLSLSPSLFLSLCRLLGCHSCKTPVQDSTLQARPSKPRQNHNKQTRPDTTTQHNRTPTSDQYHHNRTKQTPDHHNITQPDHKPYPTTPPYQTQHYPVPTHPLLYLPTYLSTYPSKTPSTHLIYLPIYSPTHQRDLERDLLSSIWVCLFCLWLDLNTGPVRNTLPLVQCESVLPPKLIM